MSYREWFPYQTNDSSKEDPFVLSDREIKYAKDHDSKCINVSDYYRRVVSDVWLERDSDRFVHESNVRIMRMLESLNDRLRTLELTSTMSLMMAGDTGQQAEQAGDSEHGELTHFGFPLCRVCGKSKGNPCLGISVCNCPKT